jgi:hypothetical protein
LCALESKEERKLEKALNARAWECEEGVLALQAAANGGADE